MENQDPKIKELAENLCKEANGITPAEAWEKGICVSCKEPALPKCYSQAGRNEYGISAMCERCFDSLFADVEDDLEDEDDADDIVESD